MASHGETFSCLISMTSRSAVVDLRDVVDKGGTVGTTSRCTPHNTGPGLDGDVQVGLWNFQIRIKSLTKDNLASKL